MLSKRLRKAMISMAYRPINDTEIYWAKPIAQVMVTINTDEMEFSSWFNSYTTRELER